MQVLRCVVINFDSVLKTGSESMSLTGHFYTCSDKILCGLGRMYAGGGELTENIDDVGMVAIYMNPLERNG